MKKRNEIEVIDEYDREIAHCEDQMDVLWNKAQEVMEYYKDDNAEAIKETVAECLVKWKIIMASALIESGSDLYRKKEKEYKAAETALYARLLDHAYHEEQRVLTRIVKRREREKRKMKELQLERTRYIEIISSEAISTTTRTKTRQPTVRKQKRRAMQKRQHQRHNMKRRHDQRQHNMKRRYEQRQEQEKQQEQQHKRQQHKIQQHKRHKQTTQFQRYSGKNQPKAKHRPLRQASINAIKLLLLRRASKHPRQNTRIRSLRRRKSQHQTRTKSKSVNNTRATNPTPDISGFPEPVPRTIPHQTIKKPPARDNSTEKPP